MNMKQIRSNNNQNNMERKSIEMAKSASRVLQNTYTKHILYKY